MGPGRYGQYATLDFDLVFAWKDGAKLDVILNRKKGDLRLSPENCVLTIVVWCCE